MLQKPPKCSIKAVLTLLNQIWLKNGFPVSWRHSVILPVLKADKDPLNTSSYRPTSWRQKINNRGIHFSINLKRGSRIMIFCVGRKPANCGQRKPAKYILDNGTAQGSIILPLLFLIMINDLPNSPQDVADYLCYVK